MRFLTDKSLKSHELHTHVYSYNEKGQVQMPFLTGTNPQLKGEFACEQKTKLSRKEKTLRFICPACAYSTYDHLYWEVHLQVQHSDQMRRRLGAHWFIWKKRAARI